MHKIPVISFFCFLLISSYFMPVNAIDWEFVQYFGWVRVESPIQRNKSFRVWGGGFLSDMSISIRFVITDGRGHYMPERIIQADQSGNFDMSFYISPSYWVPPNFDSILVQVYCWDFSVTGQYLYPYIFSVRSDGTESGGYAGSEFIHFVPEVYSPPPSDGGGGSSSSYSTVIDFETREGSNSSGILPTRIILGIDAYRGGNNKVLILNSIDSSTKDAGRSAYLGNIIDR